MPCFVYLRLLPAFREIQVRQLECALHGAGGENLRVVAMKLDLLQIVCGSALAKNHHGVQIYNLNYGS